MAGIIHNDRKLGAEVRRLTLREIKKILLGNDIDYKKQLILKLSSSILPRINEHSGEGGEAMKVSIEIASEVAKKHDITSDTEGDSEGQP